MASQPDPSTDEVEHGRETATLRAAGLTGAFLALAAIVVLYVLVAVWPPAPAPAAAPATTAAAATTTGPTTTTAAGQATTPTTIVVQVAPNPPVRLFGWDVLLEREARLFLVVALAGTLGGLVYALRSLAWYTGNRNLKYSWLLTYLLQPVVGAALAIITYVVARGGLIVVTTQASSDTVNPFGFAAIGGLVGLFSNQAAEWLKRIFEQVFTAAPKGKDAAVEITAFDPAEGAAGTLVVIQGTGFTGVQTVTFGGVEATGVTQATDTELRVVVPDGARAGPSPITVTSPLGTATSTRAFTVLPPAEEEAAAPTGEEAEAEPVAGEEEVPAFDPEEHLEAGLGELTEEQVIAMDEEVAAAHGRPAEVDAEVEPVAEDEALAEDEEGGE
jgi:IPT/TIG domain